MTKKLGPLKVWQWGAIVGGGLGLYLLLHHKSEVKEGPELVGSTNNPLGGGEGNLGGAGLGSTGLQGEPGPVGEPGPAGAEGKEGIAGTTLTPKQLDDLEKAGNALNNPPTIKSAKSAKPIKVKHHAQPKDRHGKKRSHHGATDHVRKGHREAHQAHQRERRTGKVHTPKGEHSRAHAAAVAPRSHAKPGAFKVHRPSTPRIVARPHPAKPGRKAKPKR